ncbi:MAG: EscU/YscU/HrcU family type III secretion system export apparatus switch protein [Bacillota bacterium]
MQERRKPKIAVALTYRQEKDRTPVVTATGQGRTADRIISLAREHGVPVEENPSLAQALYKINPGQEIPVELYEAVAILLSYVLELGTKVRNRKK